MQRRYAKAVYLLAQCGYALAITRDVAAVQMLEQERAQEQADADARREITAAASAAHRKERRPGAVRPRQSRRSS